MQVLINKKKVKITDIIFLKNFVIKRYHLVNSNVRKIAINEIVINKHLMDLNFAFSPKMIKVKISSKSIEIYFQRIKNTKLNRKPLIKKRLSHIIKKLHKIKVCHNDLNYSNILCDGKNIYLIDFALSNISHCFYEDDRKLKKIESWIYGSLF